MPQTALVLRHVLFEDLGLLEPLLLDRKYTVHYLDAGIDNLQDSRFNSADLVIVLGGPIGIGDLESYPFLRDEINLLAERLRQGKPTLGICLGAQLIAAALGASVHPANSVEVGYAPVVLTETGRNSPLAAIADIPVLHWHGDRFDIPDDAKLLASTTHTANQAFIIDQHVLALQFHLEVDYRRIERWLVGHAYQLAADHLDPRTLRRDALRSGDRLASAAQSVFTTWLDGLPQGA